MPLSADALYEILRSLRADTRFELPVTVTHNRETVAVADLVMLGDPPELRLITRHVPPATVFEEMRAGA
jgi:hypothetical protein